MNRVSCTILCFLALGTVCALPGKAQTAPMTPDIPAKFTPSQTDYDYIKRVVMIPMRDGVKLYTVIAIPKGATHAPIVLTRTPYDAAKCVEEMDTPHLLDSMMIGDDVWAKAGFIRVFQDVRGKYGSEGEYVMTPQQLRVALKRSYDIAAKQGISTVINCQAKKEFTQGVRLGPEPSVGAIMH